ncbi:hypothetical protein [Marinobacterium stanieri]|uniref:hypothetical protein n=1 Tax=Marinobacterium stanieri TaxID=49186 RepID=UPI00025592D8|nr:hypothetical protein [Marinobacterium stanieri]
MIMERYSYDEVIESVEEDFQSSFKLGDDHVAATMRLLGDFYREIIQSSPIEKLMFHVAIFLYLDANGFSVDYLESALSSVLEEIPLTSFESDLDEGEYERLRNDINKAQSLIAI